MIILGIDPGLCITGWGVINYDGFHLRYLKHGTIITKSTDNIGERLNSIYRNITDIVEYYCPNEVAIEEVFVNNNPLSSLKLGMARGAAICSVSVMGLTVSEYKPNTIKKAVVGVGHASKEQISAMVQKLLNCPMVVKDAADALAIAICHAHYNNQRKWINDYASKGQY